MRRIFPGGGRPPVEASGLSGDYLSWSDALADCTGYDSRDILRKTRDALLQVKHGEAAFERDSVLFERVEYAWPLLSGLLCAAAQTGGNLNVLDFGGSLGSTYFQNSAFLSRLPSVRWNVVEQPGHVETGKAEFQDETLRFYSTIGECIAENQPNVVVLGAVLQYLEHPYATLDEIMGLAANTVIIDRTPFWQGAADRLCLQVVPPSIYSASYPSWIFSQPLFESRMRDAWTVIASFDNSDWMAAPVEMTYRGFILSRARRRAS